MGEKIMNTTTLQIRIDKKTKNETKKIFGDLGLNMSTGIKLLLKQMTKAKSISFKPLTANGYTEEYEKELIKEAKWAKKYAKRYTSVDEMFKDILK